MSSIPEFTSSGFLPVGQHKAEWDAFAQRYGNLNEHRANLLRGLQQILNLLRFGGCREVRLGGSFVTAKAMPKDFDGVWMIAGVDRARLPLEVDASVLAQEDIFGGTIVPDNWSYFDIGAFLPALETNKHNEPVGIILLDPQEVPLAEPFPRYAHFFAAAS